MDATQEIIEGVPIDEIESALNDNMVWVALISETDD
jgi:hypothetical protein